MIRIIQFLLLMLSTSVVFADGRNDEYKYQSITHKGFLERKNNILLLGKPVDHPTENEISIYVSSSINGWFLGQIDFYTITMENNIAHPSIVRESTIRDFESQRGWIRCEVWSVKEKEVVMKWLQSREL